MRILKSHGAEKSEKGTLWAFSTSILLQNMDPLETFSKKTHSPEKNWKGTLYYRPVLCVPLKKEQLL